MADAKSPEMILLEKIADLMLPVARGNLVDGLQTFQNRINLHDVTEAIHAKDFEALDKIIPWDKFPGDLKELEVIMRKGVELGANETMPFFKAAISKLIPKTDLNQFSFNPNAGVVQNVINTNVAELVVEVTHSTKMAIREAVRVALTDGLPPRAAAKIIKQTVGLNSRQSAAVANFTNKLIDEKFGTLTKYQRKSLFKGMDDEQISAAIEKKGIEKLAGEYAKRQLAMRAQTIAETETFRAVNQGQLQLWKQAMDEGLINREEAGKQWLTYGDERTCPLCRPFNEEIVRLDENFGTTFALPCPPAHPKCRCHMIMVFKKFET